LKLKENFMVVNSGMLVNFYLFRVYPNLY